MQIIPYKQKKRKHAPLDPNAEVDGSLDAINAVLGTSGNAVSGLLFGLTGVSVHDCASTLKVSQIFKKSPQLKSI